MPPETDLSNSASMEGPDVSRETLDRLRAFEALFRKRNAVMNLASKGAMETFWERHILDSAQIQALAPDRSQWLDLGSGGGLPGIVTAILLRDRPGAMVHLVESVGKKAAFLRDVVDELDLPARVYNDRIENVTISPAPEAISARALAPLDRLFAYVAPWFSDGVTGYFHKGRGYRREIAELSPHWRYDLTVHPSKTDDEAAILQIDRLRRTGPQERSR